MSEITELKLLKAKLKFLGYKSGIEKLIINNSYAPLIKELQKLSNYKLPDMDGISLDDVKRDARVFLKNILMFIISIILIKVLFLIKDFKLLVI